VQVTVNIAPGLATHDKSGQLIGVHIDLGVVGDFRKSA
jgi:hypothetical protein